MNKTIAVAFAILLPISALAQTNPWRAVAESSITSHGEEVFVLND
ncbi:hypothetical protein BH20VER1_BH20VER1_10290 [soil metagenome]|jgi:hypothetical protein